MSLAGNNTRKLHKLAKKLVDARLWELHPDALGGWLVTGYLQDNPSKADDEARKARISAERSKAGRKGAAKRWQRDARPPASGDGEVGWEDQDFMKGPANGTPHD
jgi:hypothetical protein